MHATTRSAGIVAVSPVPSARPCTRRVFSISTASTLSSPIRDLGEDMKTNSIAIGFSARMYSGVAANARNRLTDLRSPGSRIASSSGGGRSAGSTCGAARSSSPSSPSSLGVIMIWCGPRRPRITIRSIRDAASASRAWATMSLPANSACVLARIRATSSATLPMPMTTAVFPVRSGASPANSGCPLYQPTKAALPNTLPTASPGIPSGRSCGAPVARITAS